MTAAAASQESPSGLATGRSSRACWLYPPTEAAPKTSSPTAAPASWPAASTTPATSQPGSTGNWTGMMPSIRPLRIFRSIGLTATARTRIRTWPGPGCGMSAEVTVRTSGPP